MSNSLVEIPLAQWTQLRDLYKNKRQFASAYNLLQNYIDWMIQDSDIDVTIYTFDGEEWHQDGMFIIKDHSNFLYFNTLSDNKDRLLAAFKCLDIKEEYLFAGFQEHNFPTVFQHFLDVGISKEDFKPESTVWYHLPMEQAEQFSVVSPEGFTLSRLKVEHAHQINEIWPHRSPGSVNFVARLIRYNDSVGAFDSKGNLVAWCLQLPLGSLGLLQVLETHKRLGLGSLLVRYMAKLTAAKNLEVTAPVVIKNTASRSMFEKLGFKAVDQVSWVMRPAKK